jgi:hypothetical protein
MEANAGDHRPHRRSPHFLLSVPLPPLLFLLLFLPKHPLSHPLADRLQPLV